MISLVKSLLNTVSAVVQFLINLLYSLFQFIRLIPSIINSLASILVVFPSFSLVYISLGITVTVLLFLVNRKVDT